jgi:predicted enzyme related to lactoylglutathione lyase
VSEVTTPYAPGTPAWTDLMVPDPRAAQDFYGSVFGWQFDTVAGNPSLYHLALTRGHSAAGIMPPFGRKAPPVAWMTYLATEDLDGTLRSVERAGGCQAAPVFDLGPVASGAVVIDPTDAEIGLWQAGTHIGAFVVNEPGALCWNELVTTDVDQASAFYQEAFGLEVTEADDQRRLVHVGGRPVGSIRAAADTQSHWLACFAVGDLEAATARARDAGGTVLESGEDGLLRPTATVRDPWGARFAVVGDENGVRRTVTAE